MPDIFNAVLNDILCYISSARDSLSQEALITNCHGYYEEDKIKEAQQIICDLAKVRAINRKAGKNVANPILIVLKDICEAFEKIEHEELPMPSFVAGGHTAFPPRGFEYMAPVMCSIRDEIAAMRLEICELKSNSEKDIQALNSMDIAVQDISEIKTLVQKTFVPVAQTKESAVVPIAQSNESAVVPIAQSNESAPDKNKPLTNANTNDGDISPDAPVAEISQANQEPQTHNNEGFREVANRRPYANAVRKNGRPANPTRRSSGHYNVRTYGSNNNGRRATQVQQRNRQQRSAISGTRTSVSELSGGTRIFDLYVGGCKADTTIVKLTEYCLKNGVEVKNCEELQNTSDWVKSFKISVTLEDREKLLEADLWPCGITVRKFFKARARTRQE